MTRFPGQRCAVLLLMLLLVSCQQKPGEESVTFELEESATRGPLEVKVLVENKEISLADLNRVEVQARIDAGYEVRFPDILDGFDGFVVRDVREFPAEIEEDGRKLYRRRYKVEPVYSGDSTVEPFTVRFVQAAATEDEKDGEDKEYSLETKPISFTVTSLADLEGGIPDIKTVKAPVDLPAPDRSGLIAMIGGAVLGLALLGIAIVLFLRRGKPEAKKVHTPAHLIAYAELKKLREDDLIGQGLIEEFYVRLSSILRRYIEARFGLRAPERTTEEFLVDLASYASRSVLTDAHRKALEEFLTHTDLVKFAAYSPEPEDIQRSFDLAKNFIEETKEDRKKEAA